MITKTVLSVNVGGPCSLQDDWCKLPHSFRTVDQWILALRTPRNLTAIFHSLLYNYKRLLLGQQELGL